jgi:hypothetical protein
MTINLKPELQNAHLSIRSKVEPTSKSTDSRLEQLLKQFQDRTETDFGTSIDFSSMQPSNKLRLIVFNWDSPSKSIDVSRSHRENDELPNSETDAGITMVINPVL